MLCSDPAGPGIDLSCSQGAPGVTVRSSRTGEGGASSNWSERPGPGSRGPARPENEGAGPTFVGPAPSDVLGHHTVGVTGFEPATSSSRTKRATKLLQPPVVHLPRSGDLRHQAEMLAKAAAQLRIGPVVRCRVVCRLAGPQP